MFSASRHLARGVTLKLLVVEIPHSKKSAFLLARKVRIFLLEGTTRLDPTTLDWTRLYEARPDMTRLSNGGGSANRETRRYGTGLGTNRYDKTGRDFQFHVHFKTISKGKNNEHTHDT